MRIIKTLALALVAVLAGYVVYRALGTNTVPSVVGFLAGIPAYHICKAEAQRLQMSEYVLWAVVVIVLFIGASLMMSTQYLVQNLATALTGAASLFITKYTTA